MDKLQTDYISNWLRASLYLFYFFLLLLLFAIVMAVRYKKRKKENKNMQLVYEQELRRAQLEIQEQTFYTISQEIHDNVGQTLSLAKVQVNIIDQSETTNKDLLAEVRQNIGKAMQDLRDLAKSLNSDHVQLVPLKDLIAAELTRMQRSHIATVDIKEEGMLQPLAHQKKLILFRIVQESLQNILKHAEASTVTVQLRHAADAVAITITDNGKGFNVERTTKADGLGLQNITHRAALIGGKAIINSRPGEGTTITLNVPYA